MLSRGVRHAAVAGHVTSARKNNGELWCSKADSCSYIPFVLINFVPALIISWATPESRDWCSVNPRLLFHVDSIKNAPAAAAIPTSFLYVCAANTKCFLSPGCCNFVFAPGRTYNKICTSITGRREMLFKNSGNFIKGFRALIVVTILWLLRAEIKRDIKTFHSHFSGYLNAPSLLLFYHLSNVHACYYKRGAKYNQFYELK